jgi:FOG: WD40-like repeat
MKILIRFALISLCAAGICPAQSMFRGDASHTGVYTGSAPREFHRIKWKFPTGNRIVSSPVIQDKTLYFGGDDGNVYAVDAETGRQIWKRATGARSLRHPQSLMESFMSGVTTENSMPWTRTQVR